MIFSSKRSTSILFLGDLIVFIVSLWVTLFLRYLTLPSVGVLADHLYPFSLLFSLWVVVFYMTGLYSKRAVFFKTTLWSVLLRTQMFNIVLAALFFFFIPNIGIAPKTNLILYLFVSLVLIFLWRIFIFPRLTKPSSREHAVLIGEGPEMQELAEEVTSNSRYRMGFHGIYTAEMLKNNFAAFVKDLEDQSVTTIVVDTDHDAIQPYLPKIYDLAFGGRTYQLLNFYDVYEEVFDRVPLSLLQYGWFIKNISNPISSLYLALKRLIDIAGGLAMGVITLLVLPFVFVAMRIEGKGPLFITQVRIGQDGRRIKTYKFRSMTENDSGKWLGQSENKVTRVGSLLRKTSLDEFPQFINVLRGDVSLVGPRNDVESLGVLLGEAIPYYNIRYIVKPGITGWAQINQQYEQGNISPQSINETKMRLAYDFYYIKHRSFVLDIIIALKTVKRMLFRANSW